MLQQVLHQNSRDRMREALHSRTPEVFKRSVVQYRASTGRYAGRTRSLREVTVVGMALSQETPAPPQPLPQPRSQLHRARSILRRTTSATEPCDDAAVPPFQGNAHSRVASFGGFGGVPDMAGPGATVRIALPPAGAEDAPKSAQGPDSLAAWEHSAATASCEDASRFGGAIVALALSGAVSSHSPTLGTAPTPPSATLGAEGSIITAFAATTLPSPVPRFRASSADECTGGGSPAPAPAPALAPAPEPSPPTASLSEHESDEPPRMASRKRLHFADVHGVPLAKVHYAQTVETEEEKGQATEGEEEEAETEEEEDGGRLGADDWDEGQHMEAMTPRREARMQDEYSDTESEDDVPSQLLPGQSDGDTPDTRATPASECDGAATSDATPGAEPVPDGSAAAQPPSQQPRRGRRRFSRRTQSGDDGPAACCVL